MKIKDYKLKENTSIEEVNKENFVLYKKEETVKEVKLTKHGYLNLSLKKFVKNKSGIVSFIILSIIFIYSLLTICFSPFMKVDKLEYGNDGFKLANLKPRITEHYQGGFLDGTYQRNVNDATYYLLKHYEGNRKPIVVDYGEVKNDEFNLSQGNHSIQFDSYALGSAIVNLSKDEYDILVNYEQENNLDIIQNYVSYDNYLVEFRNQLNEENYSEQLINQTISNLENYYTTNANVYYKVDCLKNKNNKIINNNIFLPKYENDHLVTLYGDKVNISNGTYKVRVDFLEYFKYKYGFTPNFIFGSNSAGQDLFSRLAIGILFSLSLGIIVSLINFVLGIIYGSISGYYGGKVDLIMQRISEIIASIPSTIILVIFSVYFSNMPNINSSFGVILGLFLAFIATGWIGVASSTRMQFFRYKNQEYVLASKSFGAKDKRIIFHHILPNAIGTIITSSILMIPSVIFSESSLTFLGIIDLSSSGITSIGQLLSEGNDKLGTSEAYLLLYPCVIIVILMITFNMLGNGLRDAFNTTLKGD